MPARLHRFVNRVGSGFSNVELASGERVLISVAETVTRGPDRQFGGETAVVAHSLRVHDLHLFGRVPGRTIFAADDATFRRLALHLGGGEVALADLPDAMAMDRFLVQATAMVETAAADFERHPDADDIFPEPEGAAAVELDPLPWLTRLVLAQPDRASLKRTLERLAATPA
jgi:hypothetical protein